MSEPSPFSERALEMQRALDAKEARGERAVWEDFFGILEPNPDLPDCQSFERHSDTQCELPNHHEGPHVARLEWS